MIGCNIFLVCVPGAYVSQTGLDGHEWACLMAISSPTGGIGLPQQVAQYMPDIGLTMIGWNIFLGCVPGAYVSQTGFDGHEGACLVVVPSLILGWSYYFPRKSRSSPTGGTGLPKQVAHGMSGIGLTMIGCNICLGCVPGAYLSQTGFDGHERACLMAISSPTGGIGLPQKVAHGMPHIWLTWLGLPMTCQTLEWQWLGAIFFCVAYQVEEWGQKLGPS